MDGGQPANAGTGGVQRSFDVNGMQRRFQLDAFFQVQMRVGHRSPLRASRGWGELRDRRRTAKPVIRLSLSFGGRLFKADTTRKNSVVIDGALVPMRSSNSSLSAPWNAKGDARNARVAPSGTIPVDTYNWSPARTTLDGSFEF